MHNVRINNTNAHFIWIKDNVDIYQMQTLNKTKQNKKKNTN